MERNGRRSSSGSSSPIGSKCTTYLGFIVLVIKLNSSWKSLPICSSAANEKTIELLAFGISMLLGHSGLKKSNLKESIFFKWLLIFNLFAILVVDSLQSRA